MIDSAALLQRPMDLFRVIVEAMFDADKVPTRWDRFEEDLRSATLKYRMADDRSLYIAVSGLGEKAGKYQDKYARSFSRCLVGIFNRPNCTMEFLQ